MSNSVGQNNLGNSAVSPSGYRHKRSQNSYGDESVTPDGSAGYEAEVEETAAPVDNGYETDQPEVYPAGYRRFKRAGENSYGDEQVTPSGLEGYQAAAEETLAPVTQDGYDHVPQVSSGGY